MADPASSLSLTKIADYEAILARDPQSRVFVALSEIYRKNNMVDDAIGVAKKGSHANPDFPDGFVALGRALVAQKDYAGAYQAFRKALDLEEENIPALRGMARMYLLKGKHSEARPFLEVIHGLKPDDGEVARLLTQIPVVAPAGPAADEKAHVGDGMSAKDGSEPIKTPTLAEIYMRQGLYKEALNVYQEILERQPENEEVKRRAQAVMRRIEAEEGQVGIAEIPVAQGHGADIGQEMRSEFQTVAPETASFQGAETVSTVDNQALSRLESWLEEIQQRRQHVR